MGVFLRDGEQVFHAWQTFSRGEKPTPTECQRVDNGRGLDDDIAIGTNRERLAVSPLCGKPPSLGSALGSGGASS